MSETIVIESSAPGKIILHGEYAVVFGKNAIAVSVDLRTTVRLEIYGYKDSVSITLKSLGPLSKSWNIRDLSLVNVPVKDEFVLFDPQVEETLLSLMDDDPHKDGTNSFRAFLFLYLSISQVYSIPLVSMDLSVDSEFPVGAGLGSSAAYSVSVAGALFRALKPDLCQDFDLISRWAFQCERIFHGKPSGIDNSICTFGGAILYKEGKIIETIPNLLNKEMILVYTNVRRNTKALVEQATRRREQFPHLISHTMDAIDHVSIEAWKSLQSRENQDNGKILMEMNQHLLQVLGAGHEKIDEVVNIAKSHGCSAKLTGAGGGGCVIVRIEDSVNREQLLNAFLDSSFKCWSLTVGGQGLTTACLN